MNFYEKTTLDNGIRVLTQETNSTKSFTLGIWVNVGSRDESISTNGLSHFIEHSVFKGTKNYTALEISKSLERLGGYLNAFTTKEHTCFYAKALDSHFEKAFEILSELVTQPSFPKKEIDKEKLVILEEILSIEETPDDIIFDLIEKELFKNHPLSFPITGNKDNLISFSPELVKNFIRENYTANKIVVTVAGPIKHKNVVKLAERFLGKINSNHSNQTRKRPSIKNTNGEKIITKDIALAHVCIARKTFGIKDPRRNLLGLIATLLGGMSSSRLFLRLREDKGLVYTIYSILNYYNDASVFGVYFSTNPEKQNLAIDLVKKEFQKLAKGKLINEEFDRVKNFVKGQISMSLEDTSSKIQNLAQGEFYFGRVKSLNEIFQEIDKLTKDQFLELAEEILDLNEFFTYKIIPKKAECDVR